MLYAIFLLMGCLDNKSLFQIVTGILSFVAAATVLAVSAIQDNAKQSSSGGTIEFKSFNNIDSYKQYFDDLCSAINSSQKSINMISKSLSLFEGQNAQQVLQSLNESADRGVQIRIIVPSENPGLDHQFFTRKNVKVRKYSPATNEIDILLNEMIIIDSKELIISSMLVKEQFIEYSRHVELKISEMNDVLYDVQSFFDISWMQLDTQDMKKIPPYQKYWDDKYKSLTTFEKRHKYSSGSIFVSQSKQTILPPFREDAETTTSVLLKSIKQHLYLSASWFNLENNIFLQNRIIDACLSGAHVNVTISNRGYFNETLRQVAMFAGVPGIDVRVCKEGFGVPNYFIIDDYLIFASGPTGGALYGNSLGIALVIQDKTLVEQFIEMYDNEYAETEKFSKYREIAYSM